MEINPLLTNCLAAALSDEMLRVLSYSLVDVCNDKASHVMKNNVIDNVTEQFVRALAYEQWLQACFERAQVYNFQFLTPLDEKRSLVW